MTRDPPEWLVEVTNANTLHQREIGLIRMEASLSMQWVVQEKDKEVGELKRKVEDLEKQLCTAQKDYQDKKARWGRALDTANAEIGVLKSDKEAMHAKNIELNTRLSEAQKHQETTFNQKLSLETTCERLESSVQELQETNSRLRRQLKSWRKWHDEERAAQASR